MEPGTEWGWWRTAGARTEQETGKEENCHQEGKNRRAPDLIQLPGWETSEGKEEGPSNIHAPDKEDAAVAFYAFLCSESPALVLFVPFKLGGSCGGVSLDGFLGIFVVPGSNLERDLVFIGAN